MEIMMSVDLGKAKKVLNKAFLDDNEDVSEDVASEMVVNAEFRIKELKEEMETDEKLQAAKSIVKDLSAAYRDSIKYEEAKVQWLLAKIEEIRNPEAEESDTI
jgi:hypothetical protein